MDEEQTPTDTDWSQFWSDLGSNLGESALLIGDMLLAILIALVVRWILLVLVRRVVKRIVTGVKKTNAVEDTAMLALSPLSQVRLVQRTRTMGTVLSTLITWAVVVITVVVLLAKLHVDPAAVITAVGLFGAALGIGAQNLVKDVVAGLFMVAEDQLGVGDIVTMGETTGVVEAVSVRITTIRDVNGTLWYVRNGEMTQVGNMSQGWARVILDLAVPYDSNVDEVQDTVLATARDMASTSKWKTRILEKPETWGLESIADGVLVIRLVVKVRAAAKDDVARELRKRMKAALDAIDVQLPSLQSVVLKGYEGASSVLGARPPRTRPIPTPFGSPAAPKPGKRGRKAPITKPMPQTNVDGTEGLRKADRHPEGDEHHDGTPEQKDKQ